MKAVTLAQLAAALRLAADAVAELARDEAEEPKPRPRRKRAQPPAPPPPAVAPSEIDRARARRELRRVGYRVGE